MILDINYLILILKNMLIDFKDRIILINFEGNI